MAELVVPAPEDYEGYPSLGPGMIKFYETHLGVELNEEQQQDVVDFYTYFPMNHEYAAQRRFDRCSLEVRKGVGKTTVAAIIAIGEVHPWAPCRFNGYAEDGTLLPGRPVKKPYVVMLAVSQEQVGDLAYGMARSRVAACLSNHLFNISKERITVIGEGGIDDGDLLPISNLAGVQEGKNITFWHADEPHRMYHPGEKACYETLSAGVATKRADAQPWMLSTSTAGSPSEPSVELDIRREAEDLASGKKDGTNSRFRLRSRWAGGTYDLSIWDERMAALLESQGPTLVRGIDLEKACRDYEREGCDKGTWERLQLNRWAASDAIAFPVEKVRLMQRPNERIPYGSVVYVGADGALNRDTFAIVILYWDEATQIFMTELVLLLERPPDAGDDYRHDMDAADEAMQWIFKNYKVVRCYVDPPHIEKLASDWEGRWPKQVWQYRSDGTKAVLLARSLLGAFEGDQIALVGTSSGDLFRHVACAGKVETPGYDDQGNKNWKLCKLNQQDRSKFDGAMALALAYRARLESVAANDRTPGSGDGIPKRIY